jgi:hypothetical protein
VQIEEYCTGSVENRYKIKKLSIDVIDKKPQISSLFLSRVLLLWSTSPNFLFTDEKTDSTLLLSWYTSLATRNECACDYV